MHALIFGSKEYPMGASDGSDPSPSGGMEMYVQGLVDTLARKGVQVTVITRRFKNTRKEEKKGNISIIRVPFLSGFYFRNPSFNLASFFRALGLDFDVIISNGEVSNFFSLLLSKLKRKPAIMVSHGLASNQPQYNKIIRMLFRICDRITYPNADAVVTHAPWQMKGITSKFFAITPGFDRSRLRRMAGAEKKQFRLKYAKPDESVIVYTGRLIGVKGIEQLIRSLSLIKHKHVCIIVGDGPDMEKCRRLAMEENANVVFTGFRGDVANFLSIADVFVLPSFSESLNYSLIEAAYMGVPIVCTDIGIIKSDSAILARVGDEHSLGHAINKALSSDSRQRIRNAKHYASGFDWRSAADEYMKIMKRLVK